MKASAIKITSPTHRVSRRVGTVCASQQGPSTPPAAPKQRWGIPTLVAGFVAAQISLLPAEPAIAYTPQPSIDIVSEANVADVIASLEDNEIPQLEVSLGNISRLGMETDEVLSAAQTELNAIEREAASLAEREETATPVQAQEIAQEASGILSQIEALKGMMRGM